MKKLLLILGSVAFLVGCQSTTIDRGGTGEMGDWQSGNGGSYAGPDHMWSGSNPNAGPAGAAGYPGAGANGTKPGTGH